MIIHSKNHPDPVYDTDAIVNIAALLAENFLGSLYQFNNEKGYFSYVACLSEILQWAQEYYNEYNKNENEILQNDLLVAWGNKRIKQFFAEKIS